MVAPPLARTAPPALLPDWGGLLSFITAATVLVYGTAPLALGVLRQTAADLPRPYRLRFARLTAPAAFVIANLLLIWVGWATNSRLFLVVAFGALIVGVLALVRPDSVIPGSNGWRPRGSCRTWGRCAR